MNHGSSCKSINHLESLPPWLERGTGIQQLQLFLGHKSLLLNQESGRIITKHGCTSFCFPTLACQKESEKKRNNESSLFVIFRRNDVTMCLCSRQSGGMSPAPSHADPLTPSLASRQLLPSTQTHDGRQRRPGLREAGLPSSCLRERDERLTNLFLQLLHQLLKLHSRNCRSFFRGSTILSLENSLPCKSTAPTRT